MKRKWGIFFSVISLFFCGIAFAETIVLKSGKTVEGKPIEKTDKYIKIDFEGIPLTYFFDEIESIDGESIGISNERSITGLSPSSEIMTELVYKDINYKFKIPKGWLVVRKDTDVDEFNNFVNSLQLKSGGEVICFLKNSLSDLKYDSISVPNIAISIKIYAELDTPEKISSAEKVKDSYITDIMQKNQDALIIKNNYGNRFVRIKQAFNYTPSGKQFLSFYYSCVFLSKDNKKACGLVISAACSEEDANNYIDTFDDFVRNFKIN